MRAKLTGHHRGWATLRRNYGFRDAEACHPEVPQSCSRRQRLVSDPGDE